MIADAIGLDIGGANLKAATDHGIAIARPFELWKHPAALSPALGRLIAELPPARTVAVTMTGELCDCFATKRDGVRHILDAVAAVVQRSRVVVWCTAGTFLSLDDARAAPLDVAAANWHALATFAGRLTGASPALLVDTGSTTTDVIPLLAGRPAAIGRTDPERLRSRELVYTGARRTPVCAVLGEAVAAELFATTHDVHVLLGNLPEDPNDCATADGRPATRRFAHARLARMLGGDAEITSVDETLTLAHAVLARQRTIIVAAMTAVAGRMPAPPRMVLLAGSGEFLARAAVEEFAAGVPVQATALSKRIGPSASEAACAYAVAVLACETQA
jgi:hypothetical protein